MIDRLINIASEKKAESQDHLWLLQTDPAYFYEFASYWNEFNLGALPGSSWTQDTKAQFLESRTTREPFAHVQCWNILTEELQHVRQEYVAYSQSIEPGHPLPESYDRALGCLTLATMNLLRFKVTGLNELSWVAPAWRSLPIVYVWKHRQATSTPVHGSNHLDHRERYLTDRKMFYVAALGEMPELDRYVNVGPFCS